jgi:uncharacterized membrane protein YebE (DUF533 family)
MLFFRIIDPFKSSDSRRVDMQAQREKLKVLTVASYMDGAIDIAERDLLEQIAHRMGLDSAVVEAVIGEVTSGEKIKLKITGLSDPKRRVELFWQLCQLIVADEVVTEGELAFAKRIGGSLEITEDECQQTINTALGDLKKSAVKLEGRSLSELVKLLSTIL